MHPEAYEGFKWAVAEVKVPQPYAALRVLDVGGQNVNGTVHDLLPGAKITTLDLENADIIADARTWQPDQFFDVVIATEVFEHVREWRRVLMTMRKALDENGPGILIATCASNHRIPHGATGAPDPAPGEWYRNVKPADLQEMLEDLFTTCDVGYRYPPGDAYMWGRI